MEAFLPNGFWSYFLGGLAIGAGIGLIYATTGRVAGLSSFFTAANSWWSRNPSIRNETSLQERRWKGFLVLGILAGAALVTLVRGEVFTTGVAYWRLGLGGVLVGYGTRTARGCTSGHGICGVAAGARPSLASTALFVGTGILSMQVFELLGRWGGAGA